MITAGVAIDDWKLSIFERHLRGAGYAYTRHPGSSAGTLTLKVKTENLEALAQVVSAATREAKNSGPPNAKE